MILLKQSTAATLRCGPFMDITDAVTPETGVTLGAADQAELLKASGATVDISGATFAAITGVDGWFDLSLTTSHTDTVGMLTVVIQDASVCLPVFARAMVLPAQVYDSLVGGTDNLDVNVEDWGNTAVPTTETGGPGVIRRNTAQGGAASTITLDASASAANDFYAGGASSCIVEIIGGTGVGQARNGIDYDGTSKVLTVDRAWVVNPDNTSVFRLIAGSLPQTVDEQAAAFFARVFEATKMSGLTFEEIVGLMASVLLGKASGLATATATFRNPGDSADAVVATVDADGNRSAVTLTAGSVR